jgi:predicted DNA binding CopG/RHH family protein
MNKFEGLSTKERLAKLAKMPDEEIDFSDIPQDSFEKMTFVKRGPLTTSISIRLDNDVLNAIQTIAIQRNLKYQSLIKDILRTFVATNTVR